MKARGLPCLNPICEHVFEHEEIKGASFLKCPQCGNEFQFGAAESSPKTNPAPTPLKKLGSPSKPVAKPVSPPAPQGNLPQVPIAKSAASPPVAKPASPPVAKPATSPPIAKPASATPPVAKPAASPARAAKSAPAPPPVAKLAASAPVAKSVASAPVGKPASASPPVAKPVSLQPDRPITAVVAAPPASSPSPVSSQASSPVMKNGSSEHSFTPSFPEPTGTGPLVSSPMLSRKRSSGGLFWGRLTIACGIIALLGSILFVSLLRNPLDFSTEKYPVPPDSKAFRGRIRTAEGPMEDIARAVVPKGAWRVDGSRKLQLHGSIALSRKVPLPGKDEEGEVWFVVAAHDYGTKKPRDAELIQTGIERLEEYFGDRLQLGEPQLGELDNKVAHIVEFRGPVNGLWWYGEMYAVTYKGFGYWVYLAGVPDLETAIKVFQDLHMEEGRGLFLEPERETWLPQSPPLKKLIAVNSPFSVKIRPSVWDRMPRAQDVDENGQLYLQSIRERKNTPDKNIKAATVLVLTFDRATKDLEEAMKVAKEYVLARKRKEDEKFQLVPASDKSSLPLGKPQAIGKQVGRVGEFKLVNEDESFKKYIVLGVVRQKDPERIYVFHCESFWEYHQAWRGDFLDLLSTFEILKE